MRYLGRAIGVTFAAAATLLTSVPASASPATAGAAPPPSRCTDHYTEAVDGTTKTWTDCGTATTSAPTYLPFDYTVDFTVRLRGRDMYRDSSGIFCNTFGSTYVERPDLDQNTGVRITLWRNNSFGGDGKYDTKTYRADGASRSMCWPVVPNTGEPYYFVYEKGNNSFTIRGAGRVY